MSDCPRLATELRVLNELTGTTPTDLAVRASDHVRSCPKCNGWTPTPGLPRDPKQEVNP